MLPTRLVYNPIRPFTPLIPNNTNFRPIPGPTTHPKNNLNYVKLRGTVRSAHDSSFPPFEADFVDGGAWVQEEVLASGQPWIKPEGYALLR